MSAATAFPRKQTEGTVPLACYINPRLVHKHLGMHMTYSKDHKHVLPEDALSSSRRMNQTTGSVRGDQGPDKI